jgi:hypothetical protein
MVIYFIKSNYEVNYMGFFTKGQQNAANAVYTNLKKYLKEKDGFTHVVMVNSFSKFANEYFSCEDKYTTQIDQIVTLMQQDGYEILDIKFDTLKNQGTGILGSGMEGYATLIMYK